MSANHQLIVTDETSLAATGLSEDIILRCLALKLTHPQIFAVSQLSTLYDCSSNEVVINMENGIALPRVAECLRLQHELQELNHTDVETVNGYVELIDFHSPNEVDDFATDGKIIYNGRALTAEQFEDVLIQQITGEGETEERSSSSPIVGHPHDKIIETLLEGSEDVFNISDDPVKDLLEKIKLEMGGDILMAYHLCVDQPDKFRLFLKGKIDLHRLHLVNPNPGEDLPVYDEI